jgi:hypothetical protein
VCALDALAPLLEGAARRGPEPLRGAFEPLRVPLERAHDRTRERLACALDALFVGVERSLHGTCE